MSTEKICNVCGVNKVAKKGAKQHRTVCFQCHTNRYTREKKNFCENCGFVALHRCQLDVDHTDGNKNNNSKDNLRTLCANCHRLKTYLPKEFFKKN